MSFGDFAVTNHVAKDGFVGIEAAEAVRQQRSLDEFKARHGGVYEQAIEKLVASRLAAQEFATVRAALIHECPQGKVQDIMAGVEAEVRKRMAGRSAQRIEPVKPEPVPTISAADIETAKATTGQPAATLEPAKFGGKEITAPKRGGKQASAPTQ